MLSFRWYQKASVNRVHMRESEKSDVRMGIQFATGGGKTIVLAGLLLDPIPQLVLTDRRILLDQTARVLDSYGIPYGFRAAGHKVNKAPIQLAMIQSEYERTFKKARVPIHPCDRVHVDEIHKQKGDVAQAVMTRYHIEGASIIGYSATMANLGGVLDEVHCPVTVPQLIEEGFLVPPKVFAIEQPNTKHVERLRRDASGEFLAGDVEKLVRPERIGGRVIRNYKRLSPDGRAFILFAHSIKASLFWAQYLTAHGIPTAHIDGDHIWVNGQMFKSDTMRRAWLFAMVESGEVKGLSNRFVLREGIDLPCVGHAILTCPVGSRVSFVQMCGRVLRPYKDREYAIIQDHSGTVINHPALDSRDPWDWAAPAGMSEKLFIAELREGKEIEPIVCPQCQMMRYTGDTCPHCGFMYKKYARYVQQTDGELKLVEGKNYKPRRTTYESGDETAWERAYWGAVKNSPERTFEQVYTYFAVSHRWRWIRRDLPLMPRSQYQWFLPVGQVPMADLIPKQAVLCEVQHNNQ